MGIRTTRRFRTRAAAITTVATVALALAACSSQESAEGETPSDGASGEGIALKVAFNQDTGHPQAQAIVEFGKQLEEATDGAYSIDLYPDELLGPQAETIEMVQSGSVEMAFIIGSLMENFNPDFAVLSLPYMYESADHMMGALNDPEVTGDIYASATDQNILVLRTFFAGIRNIYSDTPVNTPADLQGLKIRVPGSELGVALINAMGGSGTPMGLGEVYTAIQSGVINGAENNELPYVDMGHYEVAPYYNQTQHQIIPDMLIINPAVLDAMSEEHQQIFQDLLDDAVDYEYQLYADAVAEAREKALAGGATFGEPDVEAFKELVLPLHEDFLTTDSARAVYESILAAAE